MTLDVQGMKEMYHTLYILTLARGTKVHHMYCTSVPESHFSLFHSMTSRFRVKGISSQVHRMTPK